jgi:scyllo-inositol 2-dehydrogenase (NADP+)
MKKIRVGIIGQGRSGHGIHALTIVKHVPERFEVVAVADPRPAQLESDLLPPGCAKLPDYRELLRRKDVDLVVNATPSHLHVPISLEALEAGFDVLCEKPLARTVAEVDRLVETSRREGRILAIFQQSRFGGYFRTVRSVIDSGVLGRISLVKIALNGFGRRWDWQTLQECNGGSLLNTGPHPLDQALQIFGTDQMPRVHCVMDRATTFGDAEDVVKLILSGSGRPTIDLEISSCSAYNPYTYVVDGTQGSLAGTMQHIEWKYFRPEEAPHQALTTEPIPGRTWCSEELAWHAGSWDLPKDGPDLYEAMGKDFYLGLYETITQGRPLVVPPEHVRQQIAVIEEAHRQNPLSRRQVTR